MTTGAKQPGVTLQINLCAGDVAYAATSVAALVATHRPFVQEVLVVADACRPQATPDLHAPTRFPAARFQAALSDLRELCRELAAGGLVDRVVWLEAEPDRLRALNTKYGGIPTPLSHDHLGHAFSAYFLGWEEARTRYVAHFDADILLWQKPGYSWLERGVSALQADENILAVSPRMAPPMPDGAMVRVGAAGSGWSHYWPLERVANGWTSPWFSTRAHLLDRERLARQLPLRTGRALRRHRAVHTLLFPLYSCAALSGPARSTLAARLARRIPPFPLPPEVMLHEHAQRSSARCLYLADPEAWFLHPDTKPEDFHRQLPQLVEAVVQQGRYPEGQQGLGGLDWPLWAGFLAPAR